MGYQDKISNMMAGVRRKLFDYRVFLTGTASQVIRFKITQNQYGDREYELLGSELIPLYIKLPENLPMTRVRTAATLGTDMSDYYASTNNVFLYDVLPIEGYSRFTDRVVRGDLILKRIFFENSGVAGIDNKYLLPLQVTETVGHIDQEQVVWQRHNLAPYTMALPPEVILIVNEFMDRLT